MTGSLSTEARFYDGQTAGGAVVAVSVEADGIRMSRGGVETLLPYGELRLLDIGPAQIRIGKKKEPDVRLVLPRELLPALQAAAPAFAHRRAERHGLIWLVAALVFGSAAVLGSILFLWPLAAEPLARMTPPEAEVQLGENVEWQADRLLRPCEGPDAEAARAAAAPLLAAMKSETELAFPIDLTFADVDAPNALALPGGRVIVTRGLLETMDQPDQFVAVLAHEVAHVEGRHSLVALYRRAGLGLMLEAVTGGTGLAQQAILLSGQLTELNFSREQEREADRRGMAILDGMGLDPGAMGRAFERFKAFEKEQRGGREESEGLRIPGWLSSHPELDERITEARKWARPGRPQPFSPEDWATIRTACGPLDGK